VTKSAAEPRPVYGHRTVPRSPRSNLPDGLFHVTSRGVAGASIFVDDHDRRGFFLLLQQASELWGWRVHAWCLMGTHYHLVVEAKREQMSYAVHRLNGLYAQRFNRRHERRGHLYEGRFSSWFIHDEEHLRATIGYVLENPVRAGLCADVRDWLWSGSHVEQAADLAIAALSRGGVSEGLSLGHGL
jgi:putative transposase